MRRQPHDIDKLFAQVRNDSAPPALETLIQAQPSGSLVAVKKVGSLFSSGNLLSNLLWKIVAFSGVGILGTIFYFSSFSTVSDSDTATVSPKLTPLQQETSGRQQHPPSPASTPPISGQASMVQQGDGTASSTALVFPSIATKHIVRETRTKPINSRLGHLPTRKETITKQQIQHAVLGSETATAQSTTAKNALPERETLANIEKSPLLGSPVYLPVPTSMPEPQEAFPIALQTLPTDYTTSFMIDGFSLLSDIVQVQGEIRSGSRTSYGILLGVGNVQGATQDTSYTLIVAGAQFSYYVLGDFNQGLHIGAQVVFSSTDARAKRSQYEQGSTLSLAPYAGYKLILFKGFTLNAQAGIGITAPPLSSAAIPLGQTPQQPPNQWHVAPRMQVGVGWSF